MRRSWIILSTLPIALLATLLSAPAAQAATRGRQFTVPTTTNLYGIAAGPDGAVWFTEDTRKILSRESLQIPSYLSFVRTPYRLFSYHIQDLFKVHFTQRHICGTQTHLL